jgi:hypothetical protein
VLRECILIRIEERSSSQSILPNSKLCKNLDSNNCRIFLSGERLINFNTES